MPDSPLRENERMRSEERVPRQNRVTPFGDIVAVSARGTLMGNRGCLHDAAGRIVRRTRLPAWIYCLLEFKGRKREMMAPGKYTELFFLDEATALAAGHRPCAECQRERYKVFMRFWGISNAVRLGGEKLRAGAVDAVLEAERIGPGGSKATYRARLGELPTGSFVVLDGQPDKAWLVEADAVRAWRAEGYGASVSVREDMEVTVLTPASVVRAIRAGFSPKTKGRGKNDQSEIERAVSD